MERFDNSCYINSMYTLLQFLLLKNKEERKKTFYFFGRAIPERVAQCFENSWHLNTKFKNKKGLTKYIEIYSLYRDLEKFVIKEKLDTKPMYMADNMSYSQFFLNHMKECYLLEDGCINYNKEMLEKSSKKKEKNNFKTLRDKFLKRSKIHYKSFGLSDKIEKIYLTGIAEIPKIIKNKVEIIDIKEKWKQLPEEEKKGILNIFNINNSILEKLQKKEKRILLITQTFSEDGFISEEEKIKMYKEIVEMYPNQKVVIKPHPRETTDYKKIFPSLDIIEGKFPLEVLMLLGVEFKEVVTVYSTAALNFKGVTNVNYLGTENYPKIKEGFGEVKKVYYKI